jgi:hypothetical protein
MPPHLHHRLVVLGTLALGLGLLGLAVHAAISPALAAQGYGVPVTGDALPWVTAAGLRDGALALSTLAILRWQPRALPPLLVGVLVVPVGDVALAALHGGAALAVAPHALGTVGVGVLLALAATDPLLRGSPAPDTSRS